MDDIVLVVGGLAWWWCVCVCGREGRGHTGLIVTPQESVMGMFIAWGEEDAPAETVEVEREKTF